MKVTKEIEEEGEWELVIKTKSRKKAERFYNATKDAGFKVAAVYEVGHYFILKKVAD